VKLKVKAILAGMATYLPGYSRMDPTGGTDSARYCYSVWMRHLVLGHRFYRQDGMPKVVAELGPGDSIGIGLAALLSGAEKYFALDIVRYSDLQSNLEIFDELVDLFRNRTAIPADDEWPLTNPKLESYEFPHHLLNDEMLRSALDPERVEKIRASVEQVNSQDSRIQYLVPWADPTVIQQHSVDLIYSQAVLEHIDELAVAYGAMRRWLKPGGLMTHQIDYKCHRKADTWNGHWTYSDPVWKLVVGRRPYLLNRIPHSEHMRLMQENGFNVVVEKPTHSASEIHRRQLAARFRDLSEQDLTTSGAFVVAAAPELGQAIN
jgi:SAM-dependent methyltransferase